jgi:hypothetical protein
MGRTAGMALLLTTLAAAPAWAGGYTEGPDLSNDRLAPTPVALDEGSNLVAGTMGYRGGVLDRDFFRITVPAGLQLDALRLGPGTQVGGGGSFIALQAGPVLSVDPDTVANGSALLGWHLYTSADKGQDILDDMGSGPDKIGFTGPLPAGDYTFWIQELTPEFPGKALPPFPFELDFRVGPVPEPMGLAMLAGGLVWLGLRSRRAAITST